MSIKKMGALLLTLLCLLGCKPVSPEDENNQSYSILSPSGAPALSLLGVMDSEDVNYEIVDGSDVLSSAFMKEENDFIIAPINLGLKMIEQDADYQLLAVVTWGNLYLVGKTERLSTDTIAAFGEGAVPGKVLNEVSDIFPNVTIDYYGSVQEVSGALLADQYDAVVLAEPYLTMTKQKWAEEHEGELYEIYDIQSLYQEKTKVSSYPQAALFVKKSLVESEPEKIMAFANRIKTSTELYHNDANALTKRLEEIDLKDLGFQNEALIEEAYSRMALRFRYAYQSLSEINRFLQLYDETLPSTSYVK